MLRIPEPELMEDAEQATAYAAADFQEANNLFLDLWREAVGADLVQGPLLDLGCGPADIPLALARAFPEAAIDGVDGSEAMLAHARGACEAAGLCERVRFIQGRLPDVALVRTDYAGVISNSLLHHLHTPSVLWDTVLGHGRPGARVLIMDLKRPATKTEARDLVEAYASGEPEVLRRDFFNSLCAAFTPREVREQLDQAGLGHFQVREVSNRHLAVNGRL